MPDAGLIWKQGQSLTGLIEHVRSAYEEAGKHAAKELGDETATFTERNTPKDTGALRESIEQTPIVRMSWGWGGSVLTAVDYAPYVEYGTGLWGPHHAKFKIEPKTPDGVLAFFARARTPEGRPLLSNEAHKNLAEGQQVFARYVMHPGSPGQHMFQLGAAMAEAQIPRIGREAIELMKARVEAYK